MARKNGKLGANSIDVQVGNRIRARRLELGLSQTELADSLGVSFQQVQKYEKGKNRVGAGRLSQIANVFHVQPGYFFETYGDVPDAASRDVDAFVASRDGMHLMRAMAKIKRKELRHEIARFVGDIANAHFASK